MNYASIKCPNCNLNVSFEEGQNSVFCPACGTKIEREMPIKTNVVTLTKMCDNIDLILNIANEFMKNNDFVNAKKKYEDALNIEPSNPNALFGIYLCELYRIEDLYNQNYYESSSVNIKKQL